MRSVVSDASKSPNATHTHRANEYSKEKKRRATICEQTFFEFKNWTQFKQRITMDDDDSQ